MNIHTNTTERRIGFANDFFTLWEVSVAGYKTQKLFIKSLSLDEKKAVSMAVKLGVVDTTVDYDLKGDSRTEYKTRQEIEIINELTVDYNKLFSHPFINEFGTAKFSVEFNKYLADNYNIYRETNHIHAYISNDIAQIRKLRTTK
tara:strand:- start:289 stop:723 length:435 start_codon:yes stop_codon:yes gene_type:complete